MASSFCTHVSGVNGAAYPVGMGERCSCMDFCHMHYVQSTVKQKAVAAVEIDEIIR